MEAIIKEDLKNYFTFYSKYRGPISHPRTRYQTIKKYTYKETIAGLKSGWQACMILYEKLGKKITPWSFLPVHL